MNETIAAISTAPGRGGVAVVRVSGEGAIGVAEALTVRGVRPGRIMVRKVLGEECVVLAFKAPHSYTGEDVVEFQCHGGMVAPRRIFDATLRAGARLARRGEFTERAFLNGRIGYEGAQAVIDLIDAKTERAAEAALDGLAGETSRRLRELYGDALDISSQIEHSLDIDEGELPDGFADSLDARIAALASALEAEAARLRRKELLRHGALVVLAGEPNAGKSSLFNALVEEERAIVSPVAGTTRDAIEAWLDVGGWPVRLVDTAGIRDSADEIESEGVRRAEDCIARAAVVVALGDVAAPPPRDAHHATRTIRVHSKCDLGKGEGLNVSAKTGEGIAQLRSAIAAALEEIADSGGDAIADDEAETIVAAIFAATGQLRDARDRIGDLVLAGNAVRSAAETLASQIGAQYSADMLERLFSRFCVGK